MPRNHSTGLWLILTDTELELLYAAAAARKLTRSATIRLIIREWSADNHRPTSPDPHRKAGPFIPDDEGHE